MTASLSAFTLLPLASTPLPSSSTWNLVTSAVKIPLLGLDSTLGSPEVLQEDDGPLGGAGAGRLHLRAHAVAEEGDVAAQQLLQLLGHGGECELGVSAVEVSTKFRECVHNLKESYRPFSVRSSPAFTLKRVIRYYTKQALKQQGESLFLIQMSVQQSLLLDFPV